MTTPAGGQGAVVGELVASQRQGEMEGEQRKEGDRKGDDEAETDIRAIVQRQRQAKES